MRRIYLKIDISVLAGLSNRSPTAMVSSFVWGVISTYMISTALLGLMIWEIKDLEIED